MNIDESLKKFFEEGAHSQDAAQSIRNGREITINLITDSGPEYYTFSKKGGRNVLEKRVAASPDLSFTLPIATAEELTSRDFGSIAEVGLFIFEHILSQDKKYKMEVKIHAGILSLVTGGYLGVLSSGGTEVAKYLATRGLGNMGKIKEAISKMKG